MASAVTGLEFVEALLIFLGALAASGALGLWMLETGPDEGLEGARRRLGAGWRALLTLPWAGLAGCVTGWLAARIDGLVTAGLGTVDRGIGFAGLVFGLMLVFVPLAAAANAMVGGSPFLILYYAGLLAVLGVLNFTGESRGLRFVNGVLAAVLGISIFLVIPIYVTRSFTDVTIHNQFSHAVLKSLLVALFWYVAVYGVGVALDTAFRFAGGDPERSALARGARRFLAALPAAYVLTFFALLAGHLAVYAQSPPRSWTLVLSAAGLSALALPVTLGLLNWGRAKGGAGLAAGYALATAAGAGMSLLLAVVMHRGRAEALTPAMAVNVLLGHLPDGGAPYLGPDFWVSHLPMLPVAAFVAALALGVLAKATARAVAAVAGPETAPARPFLSLALTSGMVSAVLFVAAAAT